MPRTREDILAARRRLRAEYGKIVDSVAALLFVKIQLGLTLKQTQVSMNLRRKPVCQGCEPVNQPMTCAMLCIRSSCDGLGLILLAHRSTMQKLQMKSFSSGRSRVHGNGGWSSRDSC